MADSSKDAGTIQTLLDRMKTQRLPRALAIKSKVDGGELLDDSDMRFLQSVLDDAGSVTNLAAKHPEYQSLVGRFVSLYDEITRKAVENEGKV